MQDDSSSCTPHECGTAAAIPVDVCDCNFVLYEMRSTKEITLMIGALGCPWRTTGPEGNDPDQGQEEWLCEGPCLVPAPR